MNMVIIPEDDFIAIDGVGYRVDMNSVDSNIHAVQWDGQNGWIEYKNLPDGTKPENLNITNIDDFSIVMQLWKTAKDKEIAEAETKNQQDLKNDAIDKPSPTAEDNKNTAWTKLWETDYSQLPDINLLNKNEFVVYR